MSQVRLTKNTKETLKEYPQLAPYIKERCIKFYQKVYDPDQFVVCKEEGDRDGYYTNLSLSCAQKHANGSLAEFIRLAGFSLMVYPSCCGVWILHNMQSSSYFTREDQKKYIRYLLASLAEGSVFIGARRIELIDKVQDGKFFHDEFLEVFRESRCFLSEVQEGFHNHNSGNELLRYRFEFSDGRLPYIAEKK